MKKAPALMALFLLSATLSSTVPLFAQTFDAGDKTCISNAAKLWLLEIDMCHLAQKNAIYPKVKEFAGKLLADQTAANASLKRIATAKA